MLRRPSLRSFILLSYDSLKRFAAKTTYILPPGARKNVHRTHDERQKTSRAERDGHLNILSGIFSSCLTAPISTLQ